MKLLVAATFITAVLGTPLSNLLARQEDGPVTIDLGPAERPKSDFSTEAIATGDSNTKRDTVDLAKRAITVNIWQDQNRGGRHEALVTDLNRCYGLGNGWNDKVSSLSVQGGFSCYFYKDGNCKGKWIRVSGQFTNTAGYGFNDNISSYLCYN